MRFIFIFFILIGCGTDFDQQNKDNQLAVHDTAPVKNWNDFSFYVDEFTALAADYGLTELDDNINKLRVIETVEMETFVGSELGECQTYKYTNDHHTAYKKIIISKQLYFTYFETTFFKLIMFHELAHCILNAPHNDIPKSLMYPRVNLVLDPDKLNYMVDNFFKSFNKAQLVESSPLIEFVDP